MTLGVWLEVEIGTSVLKSVKVEVLVLLPVIPVLQSNSTPPEAWMDRQILENSISVISQTWFPFQILTALIYFQFKVIDCQDTFNCPMFCQCGIDMDIRAVLPIAREDRVWISDMGTSKPESIHVSATFGAVSKLQKFLLYCKPSNSFQHCQSQKIKIAVVIKNNLTDTHKHTHTNIQNMYAHRSYAGKVKWIQSFYSYEYWYINW